MSNESLTYYALVQDCIDYLRQELYLPERSLPTWPQSLAEASPAPSPRSFQESPPPLAPTKPANPSHTPVKTSSPFEDAEMRQLISKYIPELRLTQEIPSDAHAKAVATLYRNKAPQCVLLSAHPDQLPFLKSLAKAVHEKLAPTKIIEMQRAEKLEGVRFYLATHTALQKHPAFRESPQPLLWETPVILLAPVAEYENNPSLKKSLWNQLSNLLKPSV